MSMAPNNPFENNQQDSFPGSPVQPRQNKNVWLWVFAAIAGIGLLCVMACCGFGYWGINKSMQVLADDLKGKLVGNEVIEEHIGEIKSLTGDAGAIYAEVKKQAEAGDEGQPPLVFAIEGSKGSGKLRVRNSDSGQPTELELMMDDGSVHRIEMDGPLLQPGDPGMPEPDDFDELDIDLGESVSDLGEPASELQPAESR